MKNSPEPISKLPGVGTSIFTRMSALAQAHGAINLSQGFPDFGCDPALVEGVHEAMLAGHNQYAPMPGLPLLRTQIALRVAAQYGHSYDPDQEITITSGATEALFAAIAAIIHPGDEVVLFEPVYDAYLPAVRLAGGTPRVLPLRPGDFRPDWDRVRDALGPRTRAILLNFPHNPSGALLGPDDIEALHALAAVHDCYFISDEVYEHIVFDGAAHLSLARYPALVPRSFVISSFGKSLHTTGWKVGYCLAPPALTAEFRKIHQFLTFSTSTPFQHAIAHYLDRHWDRVLAVGPFYARKRDHFLRQMTGSGFEALPCPATYFQLMRYDAISQADDATFAHWLATEAGVACVPLSAFYAGEAPAHIVRFCFAKEDATLEAAGARLRALGN
ncbi:MAG: pyridoxal phosphate-dependent aminotransferase [Bacteroidia bacterium]